MILLLMIFSVGLAAGEPWGNDPGHNHVREAKNLPVEFTSSTLIWEIDTHTKHQYPMPTVVGDKILVGSDGGGNPDPFSRRGAAMTCYSLKDGSELWRLIVADGRGYGVCGVPVVEGDRVYLIANSDIFCLDLNGMADGNDGIQNEADFLNHDSGEANLKEAPEWAADFIWHYSLRPMHIRYQDAVSCSVIKVDNQLWVSTANEIGDRARAYKDDDPHIVVIDTETGDLIARDEMSVPIVFHGEWSSPSMIQVDEEKAVLFPDGYGVLHAFKIPQPSENGEPVMLEEYWTYDMNLPETRFLDDGREIVYTLDRRLEYKYPIDYYSDTDKYFIFDDKPVEKAEAFKGKSGPAINRVGFSNKNLSDGAHETVTGPCEIISMPAVVGNRIYLGIGRDRAYGLPRAKGRFVCLEVKDLKLPPEILWEDRDCGRTQCTASIADGLCYVADGFGNLNCWDAETGEVFYRFDLDARRGIRERSQMVADGKVYVCNEKKQVMVLEAGREPKVLGDSRVRSEAATIEAIDGLIVLVTHRNLAVYGDKSALPE